MPRALSLFGLAVALALPGCTPTIGSSCIQSTDCSSQGDRACDTSQPNGYCTVFGCTDNTCPDHAVCTTFAAALPGCAYNDYQAPQRTSRTLCLQHCQHDSDCRSSEGYICADPREMPWFARILDDNQNQKVCIVPETPSDLPPIDDASVALCTAGRLLSDAGSTGAEAGPDGSEASDSDAAAVATDASGAE
jgi:hypothetical protein